MFHVGIVGCGYWGSKHVRVFSELSDVTVSICDADVARLKRMVSAYSVTFATTDYDELLASGVDAVVIAVPAASHAAFARKALLAGKHVLIEKPFATSTRDAEDLIELAESRGLVILVGHTFIYSPAVRALKDIIASGSIGTPIYLHSARLNFGLLQPDVNVLWDLAPHDLSIILHLTERMPIAVATQGSSFYNRELVEVAQAQLLFEGDLSAHLHLSWLDPNKVRRTTVVGTKKMVVYDDVATGEPLRIFERKLELAETEYAGKWSPTYHQGDIQIPRVYDAEPLKEECLDFIASVTQGRSPASDSELGLKVVRILEHFDVSLRNDGRLISLETQGVVAADDLMTVGVSTLVDPLQNGSSQSAKGNQIRQETQDFGN